MHPAVLTLWTQTRSRFWTKASEADAERFGLLFLKLSVVVLVLEKSQLLGGCRGGSCQDQGHLGLSDEMKSTLPGAFLSLTQLPVKGQWLRSQRNLLSLALNMSFPDTTSHPAKPESSDPLVTNSIPCHRLPSETASPHASCLSFLPASCSSFPCSCTPVP